MDIEYFLQKLLQNPDLTTAAFSRIVGESNKQSELKYLLLDLKISGLVSFTENERGWKLWRTDESAIERYKNMRIAEEIEKRIKDNSIVLTDGGGKKSYLAKIIGSHPKYKLNREFCPTIEQIARNRRIQLTGDGVYEEVYYSGKGNQYKNYYEIKNGNKLTLTQLEVESRFNAPEKRLSTPRRATGRCPECDLWLPNHEITCALLDHPDYGAEVGEIKHYSVIGNGIDQ